MIDFTTGQLFDWFVSGSTAFALVERLPATVVGSPLAGTRDTMYTQIVKEVPISDGPHQVAITFFRDAGKSYVDFVLDGKRIARVEKVGVPLDVQRRAFTGIYPSLGPASNSATRSIRSASGTVCSACSTRSRSSTRTHRSSACRSRSASGLFGQGAGATFGDFIVTIDTRG